MRVYLKKMVVIFMLVFFNLSFANDDRTGFLYNLRELKEISDIMDLIQDRYVENSDAKKAEERREAENNKDKKTEKTEEEKKEDEIKEITRKTLMQGAIKGMIESLDDPHSSYFTKKELKEFQEDIKGKYVGVGMVVQKKVNEPLIVVSPIEDGPAYKAGIKPRDKITEINGKSIYSLTSEESVKKLRGQKNTTVNVTVYREINNTTKVFELKREEIELKYVKHKMLENNVGYLRLTQFGTDVHKDIEKALDDLQKSGMKALIFDLRSNPGGELTQAIKIASMFLKNGKVVSTRPKKGEEVFFNREGKYYGDFPLVILINGGSASASEIVAGALKDHKRAVLVGEKTFGKGSVQTLLPLPDGDGIKITTAKYYTPKGISINGTGIEPDVLVEDKDYYLISEGSITNVDENEEKNNKKERIKELKGEKAAEEVDKHKDIQLEVGKGVLKGMLLKGNK